MADVAPAGQAPPGDGIKPIGMQGGSGHGSCDMFRFNQANFSAFIAAFWIGHMGPTLVSVFKVDAGLVLGITLVLRIVSAFMGPFLGWIHDGELMRGCFAKCGCTRENYGRRAPHLYYAVPLGVICSLLAWQMPELANMATVAGSDAVLDAGKVVGAKYQLAKADSTVYSDMIDFPAMDTYWDKVAGFPCDQKLNLLLADGTLHQFNDTTRTAEEFGQDICAAFFGKKAVCWPGPTGAPVSGDGGKRVCAYTSQNVLAFWFFAMGFIGRWGFETLWMLSSATKWEVYPWVQERMRNNTYTALTSALGVIIFAFFSIPVGNNHELGAAPAGGQGARNTFSLLTALLALSGFVSVPLWKDAKQATEGHAKAVNQYSEWKDMMFNKENSAFRWLIGIHLVYTIQNVMTISSVVYFIIFVSNVPVDQVGSATAATSLMALVAATVMAAFWGWFYGRVPEEGRLETKDLRWGMIICHIMGVVLNIVCFSFYAVPVDRDVNGTFIPFVISLTAYYVPQSIYGNWITASNGFTIDEDVQFSQKKADDAGSTVKAKRREASYAGLRLFVRGIGGTIGIGLISTVMGPICDTTISSKENTMDCPKALHFLWVVVSPALSAVVAIMAYHFPITGQRLKDLIAKQAETQKAIPGTKAHKQAMKQAGVVTA